MARTDTPSIGPRLVRLGTWLALAAALAGPALAQDVPWEPPKGGYDRPFGFFKKLEKVGEEVEMDLGSFQTNAYKRQVRLTVLGLEELNKLSQLRAALTPAVRASEAAAPASAPASDAGTAAGASGGGGGLFGRLLGAARRDVGRAEDAAKDNLVVTVVESGSPHDRPGSAIADVLVRPGHVTGSVFGAKVNNKVRITVTAVDFKPRVFVMRYRQKGMFDNGTGSETPEYLVVSSTEIRDEGETSASVAFDMSSKAPEGTLGDILIAVTSADGKTKSGKYKIRYDLP